MMAPTGGEDKELIKIGFEYDPERNRINSDRKRKEDA